jgi:hypothetical protein
MAQADVGQMLDVCAIGSGDSVPAGATRSIEGLAMMPLSPVHGRIAVLAGDDLAIGWVRRSRLGLNWADGGDAPLGEEREVYVLRATAAGEMLREWHVSVPTALYAGADLAADMAVADPEPVRIEIRQKGTWGLSRPLILDLP